MAALRLSIAKSGREIFMKSNIYFSRSTTGGETHSFPSVSNDDMVILNKFLYEV